MKKILGFITALWIVSGTVPTVIACNTNQKSPEGSYKTALTKLINQVEIVIANNPNDDNQEMTTLKNFLSQAEDLLWKNPTQDQKYIEILELLTDALNEYQNPGYMDAKKSLKKLIERANWVFLNKNENIKSPKIIKNLLNAIHEAETVLRNESDTWKIKETEFLLEYHLAEFEYYDWNNQTHKSN